MCAAIGCIASAQIATAAESFKAQFNVSIASAKDHLQKAKALFDAGKVPESNAEVRLAHADLKEAQRILKELFRTLRGKPLKEAEDETEEEEPEEPPAAPPAEPPSPPPAPNETDNQTNQGG